MLTGHRTPILMAYDANDCLVKEHHTLPGGNRDVIRAYDKDSRETSVTCGSAKVEKAFDELGRLSSIKRNGGKHVTEFTYAAAPDGGATGRVKGADYYYIRDGLMCITGLVDANGGAVVNYRYDSWGKLISITGSMADTLGKDNPYRYKGYYYDDETGMYYLKSRYYQPEICRFISADSYASTGQGILGHNVYCYCGNNPVNAMDPDGKLFKNIKNAMKALTNKVKSAYPMAKRFVKNTFGAYASTKSTFSSPSSKQKTVTGKIKSFFSPFDVQIGSTTSTTCSEHGNRKKRVVGYANFEMKAHIKTATTVVKKGLSKQKMKS